MALEATDFIVIIGITSAITSSSTILASYKISNQNKITICNQIGRLHERINQLAIRLGVIEGTHDNGCPNDLK